MLLRIEVIGDDIYLDDATTLGDELVTDLDPGLDKSCVQQVGIEAQQLADALTFLRSGRRSGLVKNTQPSAATTCVLKPILP